MILLRDVDKDKVTAMMKQYLNIKEQYLDTIIFYRLGDFYEMFFDDAVTASKELELTLTGRDCGLEERAPMCGVPFHAVDRYISKLIEKGYKVAICEQSDTGNKKLMGREIVRIITPGTLVDSVMLDEERNNYLASIALIDGEVGIAWTDISTGEFNHIALDARITVKINELLSRIAPSEIICNEAMLAESVNLSIVKFNSVCPFTLYNEVAYDYENSCNIINDKFGKENFKQISSSGSACVCAVGALLDYLNETQKRSLINIKKSVQEELEGYMSINTSARNNLELTANSSNGKKRGSLLWLIDKTSTKMGARKLKGMLEMPSLDVKVINDRLDGVEELFNDVEFRTSAQTLISEICDIERICGRLSFGNISPKDCLALGNSLVIVPIIKKLLSEAKATVFKDLDQRMTDLGNLGEHILAAISDQPSPFVRDGGVIRSGYNPTLDEYRQISKNVKSILDQMTVNEKSETGIKNLKISYNKVFGYYIEIPKSQVNLVPYRYIRKQTTVNSERYITEELKELETKVLSAQELAISLEVNLFNELLENIKSYFDNIVETAKAVAELDCIVSNAIVAREYRFVKPLINENVEHIKITDGRHPVVEKLLKNENFVPNDTVLDESGSIMLITGPNMAGKSVYMKQVAIITILAHIGSFVPAKKAEICIVDKVFTRVGASDDLGTGKSTFMVEMSEVAYILDNITNKSLVLLDEIGRGTSTYDGLSIAWAIVEYISNNYKAKTLFSTHYHELTELEGVFVGVKNYKLTLRQVGNNIVFLRKIMRGSANKSFGIEVASLAGLPQFVIDRAKSLLKSLESADIAANDKPLANQQLSLFNNLNNNVEINSILRELDMENITPRQAFDILSELKEKVVD